MELEFPEDSKLDDSFPQPDKTADADRSLQLSQRSEASGGDAVSQQSSGSKLPRIGASLDDSTASVSSSTNLPFAGKKGKKKGKKKKKVPAPNPAASPAPPAPQENALIEQVAAGVARLEQPSARSAAVDPPKSAKPPAPTLPIQPQNEGLKPQEEV